MENFNIIPNTGTYGSAIALINANFSLTKEQLERLSYSREGFCGMYETDDDLEAAYPHPTTGSFAYVGTSFPMTVYLATNGVWAASSSTYSGGEIDLTQYADKASLTALAGRVTALENAGYVFIGIATPAGAPSPSQAKRFALAWAAGTYTYYGGFVLNSGEMAVLMYNGSAWSGAKTDIIAKGVVGGYDTTPTEDSEKPITSGGVYTAMDELRSDMEDELSNVDMEFGSGEYVSDVIIHNSVGQNESVLLTQGGITSFVFNEIDINDIDNLNNVDYAYSPSQSQSKKTSYYTVVTFRGTSTTQKVKVGTMAVISDGLANMVTEVMTTRYILDASGNLTGEFSNNDVYTIYRSTSGNTWTQWHYINESVWSEAISGIRTDLTNYYTKSQTYSKTEVDGLIAAVKQFKYRVVPSLPAPSINTMGEIYLVPAAQSATQNVKDEYITIWDNNLNLYKWEQIGSTAVDLSGYSTTEEMNTAINAAIASALISYYTKTQVDTLLDEKQDVINDLSSIRSGAAAGATAVQPAAMNSALSSVRASVGYYECSTAAATAAKAVSASGYTLTNGGCIRIKMTNANTADDATLNINGTGAKSMFYNGARASVTNTWEAGEVLEVYYDGTQYQCVSGGGSASEYIPVETDLHLTEKKWLDANSANDTFGQLMNIGNGNYCVTDYIEVYKGDKFTIFAIKGTGDGNARGNGGYVWYNKNKEPINGVVTMPSSPWATGNIDLVVPDGASYFRCSCPSGASSITILRHYWNLIVWKSEMDEELAEMTVSDKQLSEWEVRRPDTASVEYDDGSIVFTNISAAGNNAISYDLQYLDVGRSYEISFDYATTSGRDFNCGFYSSQNGSVSLSQSSVIKQNASGSITMDITYSDSVRYFAFVFGASQQAGFTCTISNFRIVAHENIENAMYRDDIDKLVCGIELAKDTMKLANEAYNASTGMRRLFLDYHGYENAHSNIYTYMVAKPYEGVKLLLRMPSNCRAYINTSWGIDNHAWNDNQPVYRDGDIYVDDTILTHLMIGFYIVDENGNYINQNQNRSGNYNPVPKLKEMIENGEVCVYYKDYSNIIDRNADAQQDCDSNLIRPSDGNKSLSKIMYPIITHISDTHSDSGRFDNFMQFSDYIGAAVAVHTGDVCAYNVGSGIDYVHTVGSNHSTPIAVSVGNHDAGSGGDVLLIDSVKNDYGYLESDGTITTHTYYYLDFPDVKLRLIALNYNEDGATSVINLTQGQITWLCGALKSTPEGYGVLVIAHYPEVDVIKDNNYPKFCVGDLTTTSTLSDYHIVTDIIDAFIAKGSISNTYTPTYKGSQVTITVNEDFSSVATGVEFIAILCGHHHNDYVGYANSEQKQLVLNITCGIPLYSDVPGYTYALGTLVRRGKTSTQDAINVYGIDRERKLVHIIRVGARKTMDNERRDYESIPYADNQ